MLPISVEHEDSHHIKHDSSHTSHEEHSSGHGDIEPAVFKRTGLNQKLAAEMKKSGVDCEALAVGSHPIERKPCYSQAFALSSRMVTNKGVIEVRKKNVDFVQVLQRN